MKTRIIIWIAVMLTVTHVAAATILLQENFEDTSFTSRGWYDGGSFATSTSEHVAGSARSMQLHFTSSSSSLPAGRHSITATNSVYLSYWVKYSTNWKGSGETYWPHLFYFFTTADSGGQYPSPIPNVLTAYVEDNYVSGQGVRTIIEVQDASNIVTPTGTNLIGVTENRATSGCNGNGPEGAFLYDCYPQGGTNYNGKSWGSSAVMTDATGASYKNNWHFVEAYLQLNTISGSIGQADGLVQEWVDGNQVINHNNVIFRTGAHATEQFNQIFIGPYMGSSAADQYMYIDNVTVATDRTASGGGTPDTSPPTAPTGLTATAPSSSTINLAWTASTDNIGIAGYTIYRNNVNIGTSPTNSYNNTGLSPSTTYTYTIAAYDAANNPSPQSTSAQATTLAAADTTPPVLSNGQPTGTLNAGTTTTTMNVTTNEAATCRYSTTANTAYGSMTNTFTGTATTHTTTISGLNNGAAFTRYAKCNDTNGNTNTQDYTITFSVAAATDNSPPTTPANLIATPASSSQISLTWNPSTDNIAVTGYKVYRCQGTGCTPSTQVGTPPTNSYLDTGLSASTTYVYKVAANDAAGNTGSQSNSAQTTTPAQNITTTEQGDLNGDSKVDFLDLVIVINDFRHSGLAITNTKADINDDGTVNLYDFVLLTKNWGVVYSSSDNIPPTAPTGLTATAATSSTINLAWTASSDNVAVTGYLIFRCQGTGCTPTTQIATTTPTNFPDSGLSASTTYVYKVAAKDAAGNPSGQSNTAQATTPASADTTPPVLSNGQPTGTLNAGTTTTTMNVTTNEAATCRYSTTANTAYASMTNTFTGTATTHTTTINGLTNGAAYTRYAKCNDTNGNTNTQDYTITFNIATATDTTPPTATITAPIANQVLTAGTTSATLSATTNEAATCRYSTSNQAYSSMTTTFTTTGGTSHSTSITVTSGQSYTYFVRCQDPAGNPMLTSASVSFSVASSSGGGGGGGSSNLHVVLNSTFESGNLNGWWVDGGGSITSAGAHTGTYAAKYNPSGGSNHFGVTDVSPTFGEAYLRMWVKFEGDIPAVGGGQAGAHFWRFISWPNKGGGFGPQLDMNMNDKTFWLLYYLPGDVEKSYTQLFKTGVWQEHVFRLKLSTNDYVYEVNGQKMVDVHNVNYATISTGLDTWIFTNYDQGSGGDWLVDDVLLVTGPGAYNYVDTG